MQQLIGYYMAGSGGGDIKTLSDDSWFGFGGLLHGLSFVRTDAEGPLHINPGNFKAAGYGFDNDERQVGYFQLTCFF